jgi:ketol-acid reductoisomerase
MTTVYHDQDADLAALAGETIAVIGYGNQGRSQALNLRDSGLHAVVGNIGDAARARAQGEGFETFDVAEAAARADVLMLLVPDEVMPDVYIRDVAPRLRRGSCLVFASGYTVTFGLVTPSPELDVVLVAPRMIGQGVLDLPARGEGFPVLVGVSQDPSGHALATALAITHGIGAFLPHGAVVESSFEEETLVDLFSEHTWAGAMLFLLDRAFKLLVEAGVSKEVALLELYASGELGEIGRAMATLGVWKQLKLHSHTSQFGQLTHGAEFIGADSEALMRKAIDEIRDGTFARRWAAEQAAGSPVFQRLLGERLASPIATAENELFTRLGRR